MVHYLESFYLRLVQKATHSWGVFLCLLPLAIVSWIFLGIIYIRRSFLLSKAKNRALATPVISIGNITLGGTGKTPFIMLLLKHLSGSIGIATRGYRREKKELYVMKGCECTPKLVGDEATLIGKRFPAIILAAANSKWDAVHALDGKCEVILLDDGLQRYDVPQDLKIATIDCACPDGYGWLLPRGLCREPFSWLSAADYFVITNPNEALNSVCLSLKPFSKPIIVTEPVIQRFFSPDGATKELIAGQKIALFSGIAHPERFRRSLEKMGFQIVGHHIVSDHADISDGELLCFAQKMHSHFPGILLVGTEKDWARKESWPEENICFSQMELRVIEGQDVFNSLVDHIRSCRRINTI